MIIDFPIEKIKEPRPKALKAYFRRPKTLQQSSLKKIIDAIMLKKSKKKSSANLVIYIRHDIWKGFILDRSRDHLLYLFRITNTVYGYPAYSIEQTNHPDFVIAEVD